jgi:hypothetical protein
VESEQNLPPPDVEYLKWLDTRLTTELDRLAGQVEKDRAYLRDTLILTLKAGGVLIGVALAILTFVGITKWEDISSKINDTLTKKSERLEAEYKSQINKLSDSAFISEISIETAAAKLHPNFSNRRVLVPGEINRIISIISDPQTEERTFLTATALIVGPGQGPEESRAIDRAILKLVRGEREQAWIRSDTMRWSQIITVAGQRSSREMRSPLRPLIQDEKIPKEIRLAAILSLAALNDGDGVESIAALTDSPDGDLGKTSLASLIAIQPNHPKVTSWLQFKVTGASTNRLSMEISALEPIGHAIRIRDDSDSYDGDAESDDKIYNMAADIIMDAIDRGVKFTINPKEVRALIDYAASQDKYNVVATIPIKDDQHTTNKEKGGHDLNNKEPITTNLVFSEAITSPEVLKRMFEKAHAKEGASGIGKYGSGLTATDPHHTDPRDRIKIYASIAGATKFRIANGADLISENVTSMIALSFEGEGNNIRTYATWTDKDGLLHKDIITDVVEFNHLDLRLEWPGSNRVNEY